jgi:hypothetical protein
MARPALRIFAIVAWMVASAAHAQGPTQQDAVATTRLNLTLEQRHVIKELIKELKIEPSAAAARSVGDVIAADAAVRPVPADLGEKVPQIKAHRFVYGAERILIVDPKDNRVAEIIELN